MYIFSFTVFGICLYQVPDQIYGFIWVQFSQIFVPDFYSHGNFFHIWGKKSYLSVVCMNSNSSVNLSGLCGIDIFA